MRKNHNVSEFRRMQRCGILPVRSGKKGKEGKDGGRNKRAVNSGFTTDLFVLADRHEGKGAATASVCVYICMYVCMYVRDVGRSLFLRAHPPRGV